MDSVAQKTRRTSTPRSKPAAATEARPSLQPPQGIHLRTAYGALAEDGQVHPWAVRSYEEAAAVVPPKRIIRVLLQHIPDDHPITAEAPAPATDRRPACREPRIRQARRALAAVEAAIFATADAIETLFETAAPVIKAADLGDMSDDGFSDERCALDDLLHAVVHRIRQGVQKELDEAAIVYPHGINGEVTR